MKIFLFAFLALMGYTFLNAQDSHTLFLFFELNADQLNSSEQQKLDYFLLQNKAQINSVHINTYCDTSASSLYNKGLSNRRLINLNSEFNSIQISSSNTYGEVSNVKGDYDASFARRAEVIYSLIPTNSQNSTNTKVKPREKGNAFDEFMADTTMMTTTIRLSILFYTNVDTYYSEFEGELKQLHEFMRDNVNVRAHIRGHVCCGDDYNLSSNRAYKIYKHLKSRGIDPSRLSFKGYSNKIPEVSPEVTEYDKLRNRRVDIIFTKEI
jgi:outer membrane protein OmpA-like peptidoglycan-associated protein